MNIAARLRSRETYDASVQEAKQHGALPADYDVSYDEMKTAFGGGGFKLVLKNNALVSLELQLLDHIMPLLLKRGWHLLRAPEGSGGFITSDRPFFLMWSDPAMRTGPEAPGLALTGTDIYFPISPRLAVVGAFDVANTIEDVDERRVAVANSAMAAGADRQVYAPDHKFSYAQTHDETPRRGNQLLSDKGSFHGRASRRWMSARELHNVDEKQSTSCRFSRRRLPRSVPTFDLSVLHPCCMDQTVPGVTARNHTGCSEQAESIN
ncbi:hypothetical protein GALL_523580 [mine drainage metagenome]|uniref:Uncharacterized protein n=1 Tax=mine drainage metagenome TaxID=410659 RepID=A0A1J5P4I0_9ZZZZ